MFTERGADSARAESASTLRVVEVDPLTDRRWQDFVNTQPNSLIYHHSAWLQVIEEVYHYEPAHLACEDASGQLLGVLPLFYMHGLFTGRSLSSLPRTPVAGPLACNDQAAAALVRAALERAHDKPGTRLQLKMMSNTLDGLVEGVVGVPWSTTYVRELPERPELLHFGNSRNHSRIRYAVNKATRLGIQVRPAETERELHAWYELYLGTMRNVTMLPRPYQFFKIAWERLQVGGLMRLLLAEHYEAGRARLVAGSLFLMFGQTVFYAFNGWQQEDQLRANDALQWRAMQDACTEGFRHYDFGEVNRENPGLVDFKSKWGTEPKWLYRYYYPAPRELASSILESNSRAHELASAVWKRLPIRATVLLSDVAHRYF